MNYGSFRAYVASNDLTTAAEVVLKDDNGNTITLDSSERIVITDIVANNGVTASVITLFGDNDADGAKDTGEEVFGVSLAANGSASANLYTPIRLKTGKKLYVIASAASTGTVVVVTGVINRS